MRHRPARLAGDKAQALLQRLLAHGGIGHVLQGAGHGFTVNAQGLQLVGLDLNAWMLTCECAGLDKATAIDLFPAAEAGLMSAFHQDE